MVQAPFSTVGEADSAYYGTSDDGSGDGSGDGGGGGSDGSDGSDGGGDSTAWGELQQGDSLGAGWVLAYQEATDGSRTRWFVIRTEDGVLQALNSAGNVEEADESTTLDQLPQFDNEEDARAAFEKWADTNGVDTTDDGGDGDANPDNWGSWQQLRQVGSWWIFTRLHRTEDRAQFVVAGQLADGSTAYLHPGGEVAAEVHIYESMDDVQRALQAFQDARQSGDVPDTLVPSGDAPSREEVSNSVREHYEAHSSNSTRQVERMVEKLGGQKVVIAALVVVALLAYQQQRST